MLIVFEMTISILAAFILYDCNYYDLKVNLTNVSIITIDTFLCVLLAVCPSGCVHGMCLSPGRCHCEPGYSGDNCSARE